MRGVPLLNFEGGPGILLLNFEGGTGVPLLNFRRSRVPLLNFEGVPGPGSRGPGPTFTPCLEKNDKVEHAFVIFHHFFKFTRSFFKCHLENVI